MYIMMSQVSLFLRSTNHSSHDVIRMKREISSEMVSQSSFLTVIIQQKVFLIVFYYLGFIFAFFEI